MPLADLGDIKISYSSFGDGPPVLAIAERNRFITFDNRGTGRTEGPAISTIDEMADDALRLLDHLEIDKTVVFGVSMGGAIAQRFVLDHPERVSALILGITFARPLEYMRR
jgi:pimeloyl-ACP methyl ester carboxylesterase